MKHIGVYILLDLAASSFFLPVAQVWLALCDSVIGVLSSPGMRVSVIGYSNVATVLLDGAAPEEAVSWTPPGEDVGMSNLNLALIQCLALLKRAPPGETPFILLASGGLVTDEPTLLSRHWARMAAGIPRYALLTGRSFPGIPFPAFGAPAYSVYSLDRRDLDRLARDLQEDNVQERIIYPKNNTIMEKHLVSSQVPAMAPETKLPMTQNLFRTLDIFDDATNELLNKNRPYIFTLIPTAKQKFLNELQMNIRRKNGERILGLLDVYKQLCISGAIEQANDFLIRSAVEFRAETVKQVLKRHSEVMRTFSDMGDELLEQMDADFKKLDRYTNPVLHAQCEKALVSKTERIFKLYEDLGKYFSDFLNARVSEPSPLKL